MKMPWEKAAEELGASAPEPPPGQAVAPRLAVPNFGDMMRAAQELANSGAISAIISFADMLPTLIELERSNADRLARIERRLEAGSGSALSRFDDDAIRPEPSGDDATA